MSEDNGAPGGGLQGQGLMASLTVNDVQRSVRTYTEGLGFEVVDTMEEEGRLRFARLQAGASQIGLGQDDWAKGRDRVKGTGLRLWITTDQDLGPLAERAGAAGFTVDHPPEPMPWGPLAFSITDPDGFMYTITNPS